MIKVSAPLRIGLVGGGTDLPSYANKYSGVCLNMAINIRQKFTLTPFDGPLLPRNLITSVLRHLRFNYKAKQEFDLSLIGSGLGSSAAATVALVAAARNDLNKGQIAEKAFDIEVNSLKMAGGRQDQYASAFGGVNLFEFGETINMTPLDEKFIEKLIPNLMLFDTGIRRDKNPQDNLVKLDKEKKVYLDEVKSLVLPMVRAIVDNDLEEIGKVFDYSRELKNKNKDAKNNDVDKIIKQAQKYGSLGGKVNGAGGGGTILLVVPWERQEELKKNINLKHIPFSVDWEGVRVE